MEGRRVRDDGGTVLNRSLQSEFPRGRVRRRGPFLGRGRDFGTGVLGALGTDWRLVVARQDPSTLDPMPDDKLPAFALIADLKPDDEEFAIRLKAAFQSFVGLVNLGAAQKGEPPLEQGSEVFEGVTISTASYMVSKADRAAANRQRSSRFDVQPGTRRAGGRSQNTG